MCVRPTTKLFPVFGIFAIFSTDIFGIPITSDGKYNSCTGTLDKEFRNYGIRFRFCFNFLAGRRSEFEFNLYSFYHFIFIKYRKKNVYFQLFIWNFIWLSLRTLSDKKDDVRLRTRNSRWRTTRVLLLRRQATKIIGWCKALFVSFKKLFPSPFSANFERSGYIFGLISDWPTRAVLLY